MKTITYIILSIGLLFSIPVYAQVTGDLPAPKIYTKAQFVQPTKDTSFITSDSLYYLTKAELLKMVNKTRRIQDSLLNCARIDNINTALLAAYDTRRVASDKLFNSQEAQIQSLSKEVDRLNTVIQNMQPAWYDSKTFWFSLGVLVTAASFYLIKKYF